MLHRSTIQLLRFHFSFFLLPVYLFAISQQPDLDWDAAASIFFILHFLVYPSSNGYNSYMDRDETPIGGLKAPMRPTRQLLYTTMVMDLLALLLSLLLGPVFALGVFIYIAASRTYSYRGIRLKQYPVIGFLTVFLFQGGWIYLFTRQALDPGMRWSDHWQPALLSSLLIGALYPLTQVYQHEADRADGVTTISMMLGKRGSFVFSMLLFLSATGLFYHYFRETGKSNHFTIYLLMLLPVVLFFLYWMYVVWKNEERADFTNSLRMNLLATICTTAFFITLIILNH